MRSVVALLRREVQAAFVSPVAYTILFGFLLICGWGFVYGVAEYSRTPAMMVEQRGWTIRTFLVGQRLTSWLMIAMILLLPGLSMRAFSEERKGGTIELLLTSPLTTVQLVLGKYLGLLAIWAGMLLLTAPLIAVIAWKGSPEWAALGGAYLGYFLFGATLLAMGLLASSITENQIVAVVLTYAFFLPFFLSDFVVGAAGAPWDDILAGLAVGVGLYSAARGLLDSHYLVLWGLLIFSFLFLAVRVLDSNRWR